MRRSASGRHLARPAPPRSGDGAAAAAGGAGACGDDAASGSGSGGGRLRPAQPGAAWWRERVLSAVNESTKWAVSTAVLAVLLWHRNAAAAWAVLGAVASSFLCKGLKHSINQERPGGARKTDPGMPSSHANSLCFLAAYSALALVHHAPAAGGQAAAAAAALTLALGVFLTWLRVRLGYHTAPQVLVGAALGAGTAAGWFALGVGAALPALQASPARLAALYGAALLAAGAFAAKNVLAWAREREAGRAAGAAAALQGEPSERGLLVGELQRQLAAGGAAGAADAAAGADARAEPALAAALAN
ncbi:LPPE2 [Scenedesmus sp. PABB004]|nr:LPPE2 [Scenedesmus sp. PABB004]